MYYFVLVARWQVDDAFLYIIVVRCTSRFLVDGYRLLVNSSYDVALHLLTYLYLTGSQPSAKHICTTGLLSFAAAPDYQFEHF